MKPGSLAAKPGQKGVKDPGLWIRWVEGNPGDPGSNPGRAISTGGRFPPFYILGLDSGSFHNIIIFFSST